MTEPDAWEPTELERKLLQAAKGDRIPRELGLRMASTLSISSGAAGASAVAHGGLLFSKSGLWGVLSVALLAGAGALYTTSATPRVTASPSATPTVSAVEIDLPPPIPPAAPATATESATATTIATAPAVATKTASSGALQAEISMLDRARRALEDGAPERAYRLLDQHRRRFAQGTLIPEAEALRIEAVARLGDSERAQRMSQRFQSTYPAHPLRERVSTLAKPEGSSTSPSRATPDR